MTISFATDDAPVVTFHVLYVAATVNIFLALQLPFFSLPHTNVSSVFENGGSGGSVG